MYIHFLYLSVYVPVATVVSEYNLEFLVIYMYIKFVGEGIIFKPV